MLRKSEHGLDPPTHFDFSAALTTVYKIFRRSACVKAWRGWSMYTASHPKDGVVQHFIFRLS